MDYPKNIVSNQMEESISIQRVNEILPLDWLTENQKLYTLVYRYSKQSVTYWVGSAVAQW